MRRRAGFSLLEVLLAAGVGMMALFILLDLLIPAWRTGGRLYARMDMAQMAGVALRRLEDDLAPCPFSALALPTAARPVLVAQALQGVGSNSRPVYAGNVVVWFLTPQGRLCRRSCPPWPPGLSPTIPTDRPLQLAPAQLGMLLSPLPACQSLANGVTSFTVTASIGPRDPLTATLTLSCPVPGKSTPETCTVSEAIHLRNAP